MVWSPTKWGVAHYVLLTRVKLRSWGIGNGICPHSDCKCAESLVHVFWDCYRVRPVLIWVEDLIRDIFYMNFTLDRNFFIFGGPAPPAPRLSVHRLWFILCTAKFHIWKARSDKVFESRSMTDAVLLSVIKQYIRTRLYADFNRLSRKQFENSWLVGSSFVSLPGDPLILSSHMLAVIC